MSSVTSTAERRRRPLSSEQLARLRDALDPDATEVSARPLLGGVDTATYALRLARELAFWDLLSSLPPIRWLPDWVQGYTELGLALPLAEARARLESWVEHALGRLRRFA